MLLIKGPVSTQQKTGFLILKVLSNNTDLNSEVAIRARNGAHDFISKEVVLRFSANNTSVSDSLLSSFKKRLNKKYT